MKLLLFPLVVSLSNQLNEMKLQLHFFLQTKNAYVRVERFPFNHKDETLNPTMAPKGSHLDQHFC